MADQQNRPGTRRLKESIDGSKTFKQKPDTRNDKEVPFCENITKRSMDSPGSMERVAHLRDIDRFHHWNLRIPIRRRRPPA